jgi:tetratricopeptide (TPR) repeat protein
MDSKDYYTVGISLIALIISIFSNFYQKQKEDKRAIRKNLSDTLESVTKINIENVKLANSLINDSIEGVSLRRSYNTQRRILVAHANFLILNYDSIVTDIDCNIMAGAYNSIGDYDKASSYWEKTINKSDSNPILHMNLRGFASFLFSQGKIDAGRNKYKEAFSINLEDNDPNRRLLSDTYFMWALVEKGENNFNEEKRLISDAKSACSRIGNKILRTQMENQINNHLTKPSKKSKAETTA